MKVKNTLGFIACLLFSFYHTGLLAQDPLFKASGIVVDAGDQSPLTGATVLMVNVKDSARSRFATTDGVGRYQVERLERAFYKLRITSVGYQPYTRILRITLPETDFGTITLQPDITKLDEVVVEGEVVAVQQVGDTTQYNAKAFKVNPDATASGLVSKMPGIVVDGDGVTANGETVEQVLLDGKRFFGQDPLLSLNTIPAEIVDKIQVYDEASDQSQLTGFDDGNTTKTMNVVTKQNKRKGQFGKVYGGYGEEGLYQAGTTMNAFNQEQRLTVLGMSNNINQQNFGNEDLAGISGRGGRGGFRRGGNQNFITSTQDGITQTHALGANFTDEWAEKVSIEGSYFFNQSQNNNDQLLKRTSFIGSGSQSYIESQQAETDNLNHRLNLRMDYKINDHNNLLVRSSFSYQDNQSDEVTEGTTTNENAVLLNQTFNQYASSNRAFNFNNHLIYQHKFNKIGRTVSFDLNTRLNPTTRENVFEDLVRDSLIEYFTDEKLYTVGATVTYTEPIGATAQIATRYDISHTSREADIESFVLGETGTSRFFNESLSNRFKSLYTRHTPSIRYANNQFGSHFSVGLAFQHATLDNDQLLPENGQFNRSFNNVLPSLMFRMSLTESSRMFIRYTATTTEPSVSELQNVIDNSDPLFISVGNPMLNQTYSHTLSMRFQKNNPDKNRTFANRTRVETSFDYISTNTSVIATDSVTSGGLSIAEGAQVTTPINVDGYWSVFNNSTYGILLSPIKNNLNLSLGLSYQRLPGFTNGIENIANTYGANMKVALVSNISEKIDYTLYYQINGSRINNTIQSAVNNQYFTQTIGAKLNLIFPKGFVWRNETYVQKYTGLNEAFDTSYTLWNMGIAKKFLKNDRGELELSVFDLLGQNQSFDQTVTAQYTQENQTQVLQRYFMLTLTYQLRRFM